MKIIITLSILLIQSIYPEPAKIDKNEYMAKYIISLVRYIEWPPELQKGNFKIGIYGSFDLYKAISEETINIGLQNRNTDVLNLGKIEDAGLTTFQIIIISGDKCTIENLQKTCAFIKNKPTLLITDKEGTTKLGAGINFFVKDNKLAYVLNKTNATLNGIKLSHQVETFAYLVEESE